MTEAEWLACDDAEAIMRVVRETASDRKLGLFGCGCCRRMWESLPDERSRAVVEVAERYADGFATTDELSTAGYHAEAVCFAIDAKQDRYRCEQKAIRGGWLREADAVEDGFVRGTDGRRMTFDEARACALCAEMTAGYFESFLQQVSMQFLSLQVIRDVFGNPFRPVALDPQWLTSDVLALARGIYAERAFDRMPILADALQDAGCDSAAVLDHCRDPNGTHVRGCWVVDLLLGKS